MNKVYFVSVDNNLSIYNKCIGENKFIVPNANIRCFKFDNMIDNKFISVRYNDFLNNHLKEDAWIVFCHNDWEIKENIVEKLSFLNKHIIYGPIGANLYCDKKEYVIEYYGACFERKRDGSNERYLKCILNQTGLKVDTLDCQCLIVHSSLIKQYGLRFDENLSFDLYVEDFCLNAKVNFNIPTNIVSLECCHWSQVDTMKGRESFFKLHDYIEKKYSGHIFAGHIKLIGKTGNKNVKVIHPQQIYTEKFIYHTDIDPKVKNSSHSIIVRSINHNSMVLDVGSACGDLGIALKKHKQCTIYGMELDAKAVSVAENTGAYEKLHQIDLNNFSCNQYPEYLGMFDYIVFGDILEHLYNPPNILNQFQHFLKPNGNMLVSLPNAGHASIKMNLLDNDWTYTEAGLIDRTHIRFFTYKAIAQLLTDCGLEIVESNYTRVDKKGTQPTKPWRALPWLISAFVYSDPHSFVFQYVLTVKKHNDLTSYTRLLKINLAKLDLGPGYLFKNLCKKSPGAVFWSAYRKIKSLLSKL